MIFSGLHRSVKDHIFVGHNRDLGSLARLDFQFHEVVRRRIGRKGRRGIRGRRRLHR